MNILKKNFFYEKLIIIPFTCNTLKIVHVQLAPALTSVSSDM